MPLLPWLKALTIWAVAGSIALLSASAASAADKNPNILLILMDNFGYGEVGVYGGGELRGAPTPHIDSIAAAGFQLTNYNVEAECTPSRSALMTGRYGIRTRQRPDGPARGIWYGLTQWEVTLAELLSDKGYATAIFGKWHLGDTPGRFPTDQGFDEWMGLPRSSDQAFWPDSDQFKPGVHPRVKPTRIMTAKRGETPKEGAVFDRAKRATLDRDITDHALDFIARKAKAGQPFFAYLPYTQTHEPVDAHPDWRGKTGNGAFADVLAQTDSYVGELLTKLDDLDITKNTIVIFTSDNGREGVPRSFGFTGPWRGSMFSPYEGSLRVPFLIKWPGHIPPNIKSNGMVHQVDVFPTLAAMLGLTLPDDRMFDGVDQSAFFSKQAPSSARESMVIYIGNTLFGAKWRNWKILYKQLDEKSYAVQDLAYPTFYNLTVDPKEEVPELNYLSDTWVEYPLEQAVEDHLVSLENDPGAPGP